MNKFRNEYMHSGNTIKTHTGIHQTLCGTPRETSNGCSVIDFTATDEMKADSTGLVHGGFIFGLADYAAMIAVNHPNVVLASADVVFRKPVAVGDNLVARAEIVETKGKKHDVAVEVFNKEELVFKGTFSCAVLDDHVMKGR